MSLIPAIITSYDADSRTVRISIPGLTDGAEVNPRAELLYTIGDAYNWTECQVDAQDPVWIDFIGGDPRRPIVMGYRALGEGNANGWRAFRHANIKMVAAAVLDLIAGTQMQLTVGGTQVTLVDGLATIHATDTKITGNLEVGGTTTAQGPLVFQAGMQGSGGSGNSMQITGNTNFVGTVTANGKHIDDTHNHTSEAPGSPTSPPIS